MLAVTVLFASFVGTSCQQIGASTIVYQWHTLEYDWPNSTVKNDFVKNGRYVAENNIISGIKLYNGSVYVTVPRWRKGVPSTLNVVVEKHGKHVLAPFPSWSMQTVGDCSAIQYSQSLEIDPITGWMWIIDTGSSKTADTGQAICPPKLIIYDIVSKKIIRVHHFSESSAPKMRTFLNDIVLHKVSGKVAFAYISDAGMASLIVYDATADKSYTFKDASMLAEHGSPSIVQFVNTSFPVQTPIDGIAISPDFRFLYYCSLASYKLYRVPTSLLSNENGIISKSVKYLGDKVSQTGGMIAGQKNLFYGALSLNAVYRWNFAKDIILAPSIDDVTLVTQTLVAKENTLMRWVDSFAFDTDGYLWFTVNNLPRFLQGTMNFDKDTAQPNMLIWKVFVDESGYI